jgi:4-diphosphocytidyl-2-C-methyl-D-erythritol kinase
MEQALMKAGALGARMSGSGPTVFGMFATELECLAAAEELRTSTWRLYPAEILTGPLYGEPQASLP